MSSRDPRHRDNLEPHEFDAVPQPTDDPPRGSAGTEKDHPASGDSMPTSPIAGSQLPLSCPPVGASEPNEIAPRPRPRPRAALRPRCPPMLRNWHFTPHARAMVDLRGFDPTAVAATCEHPDKRSPSRRHASPLWLFERGHITVVLEPATRTVVTVLLRSSSEWNDDEVRRINGVGL